MEGENQKNYEQDQDEYLYPDDISTVPTAKRSCCFYLFCCQCCTSSNTENSKSYYINKWRKYLVCK